MYNILANSFMANIVLDLISSCLLGDPLRRPQAMDELLAHPFFEDEAAWKFRIPDSLNPVPRLKHAAIFSYQSTQTPFLFRVRRVLRECGLPTVDGTMVPPGMDWRSFYFSMMERCFCLILILSPELLRSAACFEVPSATPDLIIAHMSIYGNNHCFEVP